MTESTDRIREIVQGEPGDPRPPLGADWAPPEARSLPVADRSRIVEEVVTRRLVVIDSQRRERVVIEELPGDERMRIVVASGDGNSTFFVEAGVSEEDGRAYVLVSADSASRGVSIHVDPEDCSIELEKAAIGIPNAKLTNEALEFRTIY